MKRVRIVFPAAALLSGAGNWLTFIALIVFIQQTHGSSAAVGLFLAQTAPALLVAGAVARRVPPRAVYRTWILIQVGVAALTIVASFFVTYLGAIYAYAGVSMVLRSILNPLFMTLISTNVAPQDKPDVLRSVSASSALTMAIVPALGGALLPVAGPHVLLVVNALLSLASATLLFLTLTVSPSAEPSVGARTSTDSRRRLFNIPGVMTLVQVEGSRIWVWRTFETRAWILLILGGAIFNAIETPFIFDVARGGSELFGAMMAAYGLGGLVVLLLGMFPGRRLSLILARFINPQSMTCTVIVGFACLAGMAGLESRAAGHTLGLVSFFLLGTAVSWLSGTIRSWLDELPGSEQGLGLTVWTWASQVTLAVNLLVYGVFTLAFTRLPAGVWLIAAPLCAYSLLALSILRSADRGAAKRGAAE
ncbi:MFS transporter [Falsarthrobacter nasiphocae]|uniref:MFS transporter n=1 Tax=Falsarthrobacter nasiphocae TaxID=189863 RepID=A0AAE4C563_9MICC|nr:MFS transporter [Falsarthrobacter nasiphocae]MDR6891173.1 hypothetical protein [Falsarthrobacter nasiphocae]